MKTRYGVTVEEYAEILRSQDGVCAICHQPCSTGKSLAVDHDHETGRVRGLLCRRCNRGIGHFNLDTLKAAVVYMEG